MEPLPPTAAPPAATVTFPLTGALYCVRNGSLSRFPQREEHISRFDWNDRRVKLVYSSPQHVEVNIRALSLTEKQTGKIERVLYTHGNNIWYAGELRLPEEVRKQVEIELPPETIQIEQRGAIFCTHEEKNEPWLDTCELTPTLEPHGIEQIHDNRVHLLSNGLLNVNISQLTMKDVASARIHNVQYARYKTGRYDTEDWRRAIIKLPAAAILEYISNLGVNPDGFNGLLPSRYNIPSQGAFVYTKHQVKDELWFESQRVLPTLETSPIKEIRFKDDRVSFILGRGLEINPEALTVKDLIAGAVLNVWYTIDDPGKPEEANHRVGQIALSEELIRRFSPSAMRT